MHRILFHQDSDGHSSAGVVYRFLKDQGIADNQVYFHPITYGMPIPAEIDYGIDVVYMVDFSLQPDDVMALFAAKLLDRFVWIDHHDTSLQLEERVPELKSVAGLRQINDSDTQVKIAGCELTWRHFYGKRAMPAILTMIGDWDTWRWTALPSDAQEPVRHLQSYLLNNVTSPHVAQGRQFWIKALETPEVREDWLREGRLVWEYQKKQWRSLINSSAFEATFAGLRAVMVNAKGSSDMFEGIFDPEKHDVMVTFQLVSGGYLSVSLYQGASKSTVHLGELARKLGHAGDILSGGGHAGAAGFQCSWDYFKTLYHVVLERPNTTLSLG